MRAHGDILGSCFVTAASLWLKQYTSAKGWERMASRRPRRHDRFDVGSPRPWRARAVAQGRQRRRHIGEARRGKRIAMPHIFREESAVEAVARSCRIDRLDAMRI